MRDNELIQYRSLVGFGPSSNTCPKCEPHLLQLTSTLTIPKLLSSMYSIRSSSSGLKKLGQPVPESNFVSDENNSSFLNLKIYEAKRGSLIINQKISISENNRDLIDFTSNFKKDILKK